MHIAARQTALAIPLASAGLSAFCDRKYARPSADNKWPQNVIKTAACGKAYKARFAPYIGDPKKCCQIFKQVDQALTDSTWVAAADDKEVIEAALYSTFWRFLARIWLSSINFSNILR